MGGDIDGYGTWGGYTHELMRGADVRMLIPGDVAITDVVALLKKIARWIEREFVPDGLPAPYDPNAITAATALSEAMRIVEREDPDLDDLPF